MVNVAVILVELATTTFPTATPDPLTATTAPVLKFVPVRVTCTAVFWLPLAGLIEVRVGFGGGGGGGGFTTVTVAVPTADGESTLVACTATLPPLGGTGGAV